MLIYLKLAPPVTDLARTFMLFFSGCRQTNSHDIDRSWDRPYAFEFWTLFIVLLNKLINALLRHRTALDQIIELLMRNKRALSPWKTRKDSWALQNVAQR